jgi:hypothetical protein
MRHWTEVYKAWVDVSYVRGRPVRHLKVERRNGHDRIGWDVLQTIKDDLLGTGCMAVEIYPPAHEVINDANRRHLWEVPEDLIPHLPNLTRLG